MRFALAYLQRRGAPVLPFHPSANTTLFKEASELEVRALCVEHLLEEENDERRAEQRQREATRKVLGSKRARALVAGLTEMGYSEDAALRVKSDWFNADYSVLI